MPTYDYKCIKCEHKFEFFQPMTAEPLTTCPECGGELKRLIGTGAGPIFKGSGFYQTDYKNNSGNGREKVSAPVKTPPKKTTSSKEQKKSRGEKKNQK